MMSLRINNHKGFSLLLALLLLAVIISIILPSGDSKIIRLRKKKVRLATQAASALFLLRKPKKVVFPLPVPLPLPVPIITKHDPVIHPIDPLYRLVDWLRHNQIFTISLAAANLTDGDQSTVNSMANQPDPTRPFLLSSLYVTIHLCWQTHSQYLAFEKGLWLSGLGGLPGGFSTYGRRK